MLRHPRLRRWLMHVGQEKVAYIEDQIARPSIPNGQLMASSEAIEDFCRRYDPAANS